MGARAGRRLMAVIALLPVLCAAAASAEQQPAMLDLSINGIAHGQTYVVIDSNEVWVDAGSLAAAGVRVPEGDRRTWNDRTLVRLRALAPGITYELDEISLTLRLTVKAALLGGAHLDLLARRPEGVEYKRAPSAFLNYGTSVMSSGSSSASFEAGLSAKGALVTSTGFADATGAFRRGLTAITFDDPRRMNRYVIGDAVASTGALGGTVQMAGVTASRDFSLDPYFVRFPTIGLSGAVMTPSRLEVYVNNQLVRVEQLPPGVYQLDHLPLPVGAADARVVVRDAFGGEQSFSSAYYISQGVLGRGVQQFAYSAGAERQDQFYSSWSYDRPVVLGLHRLGLTDWMTVGGRVEASNDVTSGGPMATIRIGRLGDIEAIGASSRSSDGAGYASSLAYEYTSRTVGIAVASRNYSAGYSTLSSRYQPWRTKADTSLSATTRIASRATLGASWQSLTYYLRYPSAKRGAVTTSVTLNRRLSIVVSGNRSLANTRWSTGGFAGLSVAVASRDTANVSAERGNGRTLQTADLQHTLPFGNGLGYHVQGTTGLGDSANLDAELRAQTSFGKYDVRQSLVGGKASTIADASGGIVLIGGGLHFTRPVQDGFALVRVPDVAGVRTYVSNQEIGRTGRHGDLVVPNLLAYYGNRVSINDADVPMNRDLPRDALLLAPPYRGGAIALFAAPRSWRITGRFVVLRGQTLLTPENWGLTVEAGNTHVQSALGADGAFYLEGLAPGQLRAVIAGDGLSCEVTLRVPASDQPVIQTGVTTCSAVRPITPGEVK